MIGSASEQQVEFAIAEEIAERCTDVITASRSGEEGERTTREREGAGAIVQIQLRLRIACAAGVRQQTIEVPVRLLTTRMDANR